MSKPFIVVGGKIDHGGAVASSTATTDINGLPVARIGDKVVCSQHGDTVIVSGDPTTIIDGQPVARHGDKTACGATLIAASQVQVFLDSGGGRGGASGAPGGQAGKSGSLSAVTSTPASNDEGAASGAEYDEQIQFVNANGAKLAGVDYRVKLENGEIRQGTTDVDGRTGRMATVQPTRIVSAELSASQTSCCILHAAQGASAPLTLQVSAATNATQLGSSIQQVATPAGTARGLTSGEIAMARLVFADSVDYSRVKVHNGEYLWFGMQPNDTAMTPNGEMYFNESYFEEDFSVKRIDLQHWFIHEMTHVWQHQLGYPVKLRGAVRIGLSYRYELEPEKRLGDYNMEAQGNILADYFLIKFRNAPGAISERRYSRDANALQLMEAVLADFLRDPGNKENLS
ncbi:PAAR domain-containing protein [Lysobacter sp. F6437]|uniref:PAAR domain-containing protein n=1 Tax=Lysobacter sp. F6437 TaxID=3459296 RepID=UPI00403E240A